MGPCREAGHPQIKEMGCTLACSSYHRVKPWCGELMQVPAQQLANCCHVLQSDRKGGRPRRAILNASVHEEVSLHVRESK